MNSRRGPNVGAKEISTGNLQEIIRAAPVRSMQPQYDRIFPRRVVTRRDEQPVLHRLAAGAVIAAREKSVDRTGLRRLRAQSPEGQKAQNKRRRKMSSTHAAQAFVAVGPKLTTPNRHSAIQRAEAAVAQSSSALQSASENAFVRSLSTSTVPTTAPSRESMIGMIISDFVLPNAVR